MYLKDALSGGRLARPVKVVLAAGNGTAGRFVPAPSAELWAVKWSNSIARRTGSFGGTTPTRRTSSSLKASARRPAQTDAELGIGIDGDGDRIGVVDDQGREVFSDKLGLLVARWICPANPGRSVVIDVKSTGLFYDDPILRGSDSQVITCKTGHSYIKAKVAETNAIAGFEKSGHWFFNQPLGRGYDDAVLSSVHLLRMLVASDGSLSALVDGLPKTWQSPTLGPYCADDAKYSVVEEITAQYERERAEAKLIGGRRIKEIVTVNGVRFRLEDDSWGLVRASSNKPALAVVAESRTSRDQLYDIVEDIQGRLAGTGRVGEYDQAYASPISISMTPERLREIEQLYHAALEQESDHRQSFLAGACGTDEDLREEVTHLLARGGSTRDLAGLTGLWDSSANDIEIDTTLNAGARLGPYQIVSPLGEGGMGKVYRALDTRLGRAVAVKISSEPFSKRFEHEARAISALNHPNICTLYDVGSLPSGAWYMVTELVEGKTLRDWLKHSPTLERSLGVIRQIIEALRAAHEAGIVHRDLKPANIMVRFDGYIKVLDFGLAKRIPGTGALKAEETATLSVTVPGQIVGTVAYMSPEQIIGAGRGCA